MSELPQQIRHRVLIVDDEEAIRLLLARIVSNDMGVEVTLAGTCEQAVRLGRSYAYDAILLDLMMPGIGGFGVLKELRANSPNVSTPIIIVSSLTEPDMIERCMSAGASAYLIKPVERHSLSATLQAQIAGRVRPRT
jgi:DNA-binding response OmpR family regulator